MRTSTVRPAISTGARKGSFQAWLVRQFGNPSGFWGHVAGWVMARRPSNRRRNAWTVGLLNLRPGERVLEIGCGPGLALSRAAARVGDQGFVAGIDGSDVMVAQAARRNAAVLAEQRMQLRVAGVEALPDLGGPFDAVLAVNTIGFWPDPLTRLRELHGLLVPGGRMAITVQPRSKGATAETSVRVGAQLQSQLHDAGFTDVEGHTLELDPPAVCAIGTRARLGTDRATFSRE